MEISSGKNQNISSITSVNYQFYKMILWILSERFVNETYFEIWFSNIPIVRIAINLREISKRKETHFGTDKINKERHGNICCTLTKMSGDIVNMRDVHLCEKVIYLNSCYCERTNHRLRREAQRDLLWCRKSSGLASSGVTGIRHNAQGTSKLKCTMNESTKTYCAVYVLLK